MKHNARRLAWLLVPLASCLSPACQQQMAVQPSYRPDQPSSFYPDGRAARPAVPGTVARGHLRTDLHLFTGNRTREPGKEDNEVDTFPFPVTRRVLEHGRDRYMIYCVVCHDPLGTGRGKIVERGYTPPPSFHIERLRKAPAGHLFQVITNGYGSMPDYKQQVAPPDRWAIAAYLRALQLSQHFPEKELTDDMRAEWERQGDDGGPAR